MILAAAACGEGEADPPPELTLAWQCEQFHALPYPGGLLDQPAGLLRRVAAAVNTYNAWRGYTQAPYKSEWVSHNPDGWKIITEVINARKLYDKSTH